MFGFGVVCVVGIIGEEDVWCVVGVVDYVVEFVGDVVVYFVDVVLGDLFYVECVWV